MFRSPTLSACLGVAFQMNSADISYVIEFWRDPFILSNCGQYCTTIECRVQTINIPRMFERGPGNDGSEDDYLLFNDED